MADDISNKLLQFALRSSNLPKAAIEPDNIENENLRNASKLSISNKPKGAKGGSKEYEVGRNLIKLMANDGNQSAMILTEHFEDLSAKLSPSRSINAKSDRKVKPTKEQLNKFKDDWIIKNGHEYGWLKSAKSEFGLSYPKIKMILNEV